MSQREPLSVAVITLDEQPNLARCLDSVAWAEEIVVVDGGSTDATCEIARSRGARVIQRPWPGFVAQKNRALEAARHRWVLCLDADEWLGDDLATEIRRVLEAPAADAYAVNRLTALSGSFLRHAWSPDWTVRLLRKDRGRFVGGRLHERVELAPSSRVARLRGRLLHLSYRSIADYVARQNRYSDLAAASLHDRGRPPSRLAMLLSPLAMFLKRLVLKGGLLDGTRGLIVSCGDAYYTFLKYAKLWELHRTTDPRFAAAVPPTSEDPEPGAAAPPPRAGPSSGAQEDPSG